MDYTYDLVGKILQVNDPTGTYAFAYDNMGRLIGTTTSYAFLSGTLTNSYSYDADSNRTGFTAPDGSTNAYSYDTLNRLGDPREFLGRLVRLQLRRAFAPHADDAPQRHRHEL